jgi:hypothetical protein
VPADGIRKATSDVLAVELVEEIDATTRANRERRDVEGDRRILRRLPTVPVSLFFGPRPFPATTAPWPPEAERRRAG